jgi:hypothetical protein
MELPHRFPFLWLDRSGPGIARLELSANSFWMRGAASLPAPFCAEIVAQAAARLLEDPGARGEPGQRWLAGIESLELARPLRAGEHLEVRVRPEARFGGIVKVTGEIWAAADGEPERLCTATLLLSA